MKEIQIKGIFLDNVSKMFSFDLNDLAKKNNLSVEEVKAKLDSKAEEIRKAIEPKLAKFVIDKNKFDLKKFIEATLHNQTEILKENNDLFHYFIFYINGCVVLYEKAVAIVDGKNVPSTISMSLALYGIVLRRVQQIVTMLMDGYIDGAMMVWRSMYEYAITLMVIALEDNDELANRYFQHSLRNSKKKVESYKKHFEALKFKPLPKRTDKTIVAEESRLTKSFGKDFLDNEYGWADMLFTGKQKANLRNLEEIAGFSRYRPYYLICTEQTHSNFNGFKHFMEKNAIILPRILKQEREREAFIDPAQFSVAVLDEVTDYILYTFSDPDEYSFNSELLRQSIKLLEKTYSTKRKKKKVV